jgi:hypothetical protein
MTKEYDTFIENISDLKEGEEIELTVRDLSNLKAVDVRGIISKSQEKLSGSSKLWIRDLMGRLDPDPWAIKILENIRIVKKPKGL